MLGYHVFYNVSGGKKNYNTTEFYPTKDQAQKRALELNIASNISFIAIRELEITPLHVDVIKGNDYAKKYVY